LATYAELTQINYFIYVFINSLTNKVLIYSLLSLHYFLYFTSSICWHKCHMYE